jgi:hypothetical protein
MRFPVGRLGPPPATTVGGTCTGSFANDPLGELVPCLETSSTTAS